MYAIMRTFDIFILSAEKDLLFAYSRANLQAL